MRVIFMGSPEFALPTLDALHQSKHEVVAVYSQPPKPANRGHKMTPCPVHAYAEEHNIPVHTPQTLKRDAPQKEFAEHKPDIAVVVAYGLMLPKEILDTPTHGCINLHPSLLPRWRGASPIQRPIMAGDTETAATIMQMDEGWDTGDILLYKKVPITQTTTTPDMQETLATLGAELIIATLVGIENNLLKPIKQDDAAATHAAKLSKEDSAIDWKRPAAEIERHIRALQPWPGSTFRFKDEQIKVLKAMPIDQSFRGKPGEVLTDESITGGKFWVVCGQNILQINDVQRPSRKPMPIADMLKAFPIGDGDILG